MKINKQKIFKVFITGMMLLSVIPSTLVIQAKEKEVKEVVTEIDDAQVGTGLNQFEFKGTWIAATGVGVDFKGTEHWTNKSRWGDKLPSVTLRFKGNKIELFGKKDKDLGIFNAIIDGNDAAAEKIDCYNVLPQNQERLYVKEGLSEGEHTITFQLLKEFNATSGEKYDKVNVGAVIDYAKSYSMEEVDVNKQYETIINDHDMGTDMFNFSYTGKWGTSTGYPDKFYNGDEHWKTRTEKTEPYLDLKFYGNKIALYGKVEDGAGLYDISIDGNFIETVDTYSKEAKTQQKIFEKDNLIEGEHTLRLVATNRKNPASAGFSAEIDYAIATHKIIQPTNIHFEQESMTIEAGLSGNVKAMTSPNYATGTISYEIENENIATINNKGEIEALKAGTTNIKASVEGYLLAVIIPLTILPEGTPLVASVGDINYLTTQDNYKDVLKDTETGWSDVAWRGDILNSKINTASKKPIHNATVIASDFRNGSAIISSSNIEVKWLKETLANIGRGNSGAPVKPFPDVIHKGGKLDIKAKKVQSAWININIPKDAKPGIYTGTMTVNADELNTPIVFNYTFEVLDLLQPDPKSMDTQVQIWQHPFSVANYYNVKKEDYFNEGHLKYMRESLKEYASLGGKDVVANIVDEAWGHQSYYGDPSMVQWKKKKDGTFEFDYDWFDKWINFNIENGVLDPKNGIGQIKCFSIVPWGDTITYFDETTNTIKTISPSPGSDVWKAMWNDFLTDFMMHVEDKGWFDITYIALDERPMDRVGPALDLIESVTNKNGEYFKVSSAFNYESGNDYSFLDRIDDVSIGLSHVNDASDDMRNMAAHRKERGLLTTIYTCTGDYPGNFTISDMSDNAWCMWYTMTQNTDGYMKWAWDNWVPDPLTNVTYKYWEPGDGWFIYPTEKGKESDTYFYKTPRYELLKQGVRDINKAKYLMENSKALSSEIDTLVKSLKRPNAGGNGYGSAVPKTEEDRALTGSEVIRMRKGIMNYARKYIDSTIIPVTSITVDKETVSLEVGETTIINTIVLPENASNKNVLWKAANREVAIVDNGKITAVAKGTTTITVVSSDGKITKEIKVTVKENKVPIIPVTMIKVNKETVSLKVGETSTIKATVLPENATNKKVTWKTSNNEVAIVNNGKITAMAKGTTKITVMSSDGMISKEIKVNVTENNGVKKPVENGKTPATGDSTNIAAWGIFSVLAGIFLIILNRKKKIKSSK